METSLKTFGNNHKLWNELQRIRLKILYPIVANPQNIHQHLVLTFHRNTSHRQGQLLPLIISEYA